MSTWHKTSAVGAVFLVVLLAGCSSDGDEPDDPASTSAAEDSSGSNPTAPVQSPNSPDPGVQTDAVTEPPTPKGGDQASVLDSLPGSEEPGCVDVGDEQTVRSGQVASGDYMQVRQSLQSDSPVSVFFVPEQAKGVRSVTVEVTGPDGKTKQVTSRNRGTANDWQFISAILPLKANGEWEIRATLGGQSGCFRVNLTQ